MSHTKVYTDILTYSEPKPGAPVALAYFTTGGGWVEPEHIYDDDEALSILSVLIERLQISRKHLNTALSNMIKEVIHISGDDVASAISIGRVGYSSRIGSMLDDINAEISKLRRYQVVILTRTGKDLFEAVQE
jgi:hypothetical protein